MTKPIQTDNQKPAEEAGNLPVIQVERPVVKITDVLDGAREVRTTAREVLAQGASLLEEQSVQEKARLDALRAEFIPKLQTSDRASEAFRSGTKKLEAIRSGANIKPIQGAIRVLDEQIPQLQSQFDRLPAGEVKDKTGQTLKEARQKRSELQQALQAQQEEDARRESSITADINTVKPLIAVQFDEKYSELQQKEVIRLTNAKAAYPKIVAAVKAAQLWLTAEKKQGSAKDARKTLGTFLSNVNPKGLIMESEQGGNFEIGPEFVTLFLQYKEVKSLNFGTQLQSVLKIANSTLSELSKAATEERKQQLQEFRRQSLKPGQVIKDVAVPSRRKGGKDEIIGAVILQQSGEGATATLKVANTFTVRYRDRETLTSIVQAAIAGKTSRLGKLVDVQKAEEAPAEEKSE